MLQTFVFPLHPDSFVAAHDNIRGSAYTHCQELEISRHNCREFYNVTVCVHFFARLFLNSHPDILLPQPANDWEGPGGSRG